MRKIHKLIPAIALALAGAKAASAQVLYEPFNYPVDSTATLDANAADANKHITSSGTYWARRGSQTGLFTVGAGLTGPTAPGVVLPQNMGGGGLYPSTGTGRTPSIGFGQTFTSGEVYYSLQLKVPTGTLGSTAGFLAGLANFSIPTPNALGIPQAALRYQRAAGSTTSYNIGVQEAGGASQFAPGAFTAGDTLFVVVRHTIVPGTANDKVDLWVNPTTGFGDNTAIPATSVAQVTSTNDPVDSAVPSNPMIAGFFMRSFSSTTGFTIDELRVDNTWAGVTPDGTKQFSFNNNSGGAWTGNWNNYQGAASATDPNGTGHVANFGSSITSGSTITVDGGGRTVDTINFNNAGSLTIGGTDALTFSSNASAAQIYNYAGSHTINAPITLASNLSIKTQPGTTLTLNGLISGASKTLGIYGQGTVKLGGTNQMDSSTRLEARSGTLDLNGHDQTVSVLQLGTSHPNNGVAIGAGVLYNGDLASGNIIGAGTITAGSYDLQSGTISSALAGTNGVNKNLAGFVELSGHNTYTGTTTVNSGMLTLSGTNDNAIIAVLNTPPAVSAAISTLAITSNASLGGNGASVTINGPVSGTSGTLQLNNDMTLAADRTINAVGAQSRIAVATGKTGQVDAVVSGTGGLAAAGPGTLVLTANNTYTGNTFPTGGTLSFSSLANLGDAANNITFNGGNLKPTTSLNIPKAVVLNPGGGTVESDPGVTPTFSGVISGVAANPIGKNGDGRIVFAGTNTYGGVTTVNRGVVRITNGSGLGATDAASNTIVTGGSDVTNNAGIELDGSAGDIALAEPIQIRGKTSTGGGNATPHINNVAGNNTITAPITLGTTGTWYNLQSDAGKLTVGDIVNTLTGSNRNLNLRGEGNGEITGTLSATSTADLYNVSKFGNGTWTISGPASYNGSTTVNAGTLRTIGAGSAGAPGGSVVNNGTFQSYSNNTLGTVTGTGTTVVGDGTTAVSVTANHVRQAALNVANGSTLKVNADTGATGVSNVAAVTIGASGKFNLNSNKLITLTAPGTASGGTYGGLQGEVQRAYDFGGWDGNGLTTTQQSAVDGLTTIGIATGEQVRGLGPTDTDTFAGQTITGASTIAMYTYAGDANLDGTIDGGDYGIIDNFVQVPGADGYANGDFNYDGVIDGGDYGIIDNNIQAQGAPFPTSGSAESAGLSGVTAVPEPTALGFAIVAGAGLLGRRRRRSK